MHETSGVNNWALQTGLDEVRRKQNRESRSCELFQVHRTLIAKAFEHRAQAVELCIGQ
jgi:hypothetical protein